MFRFALSSLSVIQRQTASLLRVGQVALACSAVALLSACGGGDRAEPYRPDRVVAFGDDNSAFTSATVGAGQIRGLVYSVNDVLFAGGYCDEGVAASVCNADGVIGGAGAADDFLAGSAFVFTPASAGLPLGTGSYVTPTPSDPLTINRVQFLGLGGVAYTASGGAATSDPTAKQDWRSQYACGFSVIAVQRISAEFGKGFADDCPLMGRSGATSYAAAGDKIADLQAQVNAAQAAGLLRKGTLTTVWIGQNDIIEIAEDTTTHVTLDAKILEAKVRADRLARVIEQIYRTDAKIVVIGVVDLGFSPWAVSRIGSGTTACETTRRSDGSTVNGCNGDVQKLVQAFNATLKLGDKATGYKGLQDYSFRGRDYTFVESADILESFALNSSYENSRVCPAVQDLSASPVRATIPSVQPDGTAVAFTNAAGGVMPVQYCTSATLVTGGSTATYLWADGQRLGWPVHEAIANAALARAVNQF